MKEIIKEVRVRGREITLGYRIPLNPPKSPVGAISEGFFTVGDGGRSRNRTYDLAHVRRAL